MSYQSHLQQVRVACIQMQPEIGQTQGNIDRSVEAITEAASEGANIVVLPELTNSGYSYTSPEEAHSLSEVVPVGPASTAWARLSADKNVIVVAGVAERADDGLYNSAVVFGPAGHIGTYRKAHLWNYENVYFRPGDSGFQVFDTPFGRLGTIICYDCWFPESYRTCALGGAELVCVPTNWVPIPGQTEDAEPMANTLVRANAHSNSVPIAAANRIGIERQQEFIGRSLIVDHTGTCVAGPATSDKEELLYADLSLKLGHTERNLTEFNNLLEDRRGDLYERAVSLSARDVSH